jgi:hypothetical protein
MIIAMYLGSVYTPVGLVALPPAVAQSLSTTPVPLPALGYAGRKREYRWMWPVRYRSAPPSVSSFHTGDPTPLGGVSVASMVLLLCALTITHGTAARLALAAARSALIQSIIAACCAAPWVQNTSEFQKSQWTRPESKE